MITPKQSIFETQYQSISVTMHRGGRNYPPCCADNRPGTNGTPSRIQIPAGSRAGRTRECERTWHLNPNLQVVPAPFHRIFPGISDEIAFHRLEGARSARAVPSPLDLAIPACFCPRWNRSYCTLICQAAATLQAACPPRTPGGCPLSEPR